MPRTACHMYGLIRRWSSAAGTAHAAHRTCVTAAGDRKLHLGSHRVSARNSAPCPLQHVRFQGRWTVSIVRSCRSPGVRVREVALRKFLHRVQRWPSAGQQCHHLADHAPAPADMPDASVKLTAPLLPQQSPAIRMSVGPSAEPSCTFQPQQVVSWLGLAITCEQATLNFAA